GFSGYLRKEVAKSQKVYFVDLGIRNAILQELRPTALREDRGRLWENVLVIERMKRHEYAGIGARYWVWRTYDRQEIDLVEERPAGLSALELKWSGAGARIAKLWRETYPD